MLRARPARPPDRPRAPGPGPGDPRSPWGGGRPRAPARTRCPRRGASSGSLPPPSGPPRRPAAPSASSLPLAVHDDHLVDDSFGGPPKGAALDEHGTAPLCETDIDDIEVPRD